MTRRTLRPGETYATPEAEKVQRRIEETRAIEWLIDRRIEQGRTDDEITAELVVAIPFICGAISFDEALRAVEGVAR